MCLVDRGIILHEDTIVFQNRRKVFAQHVDIDSGCDAPSFSILVLFYYYQIRAVPEAKICPEYLCFPFRRFSLDCL
jgi:hypothetical protein